MWRLKTKVSRPCSQWIQHDGNPSRVLFPRRNHYVNSSQHFKTSIFSVEAASRNLLSKYFFPMFSESRAREQIFRTQMVSEAALAGSAGR